MGSYNRGRYRRKRKKRDEWDGRRRRCRKRAKEDKGIMGIIKKMIRRDQTNMHTCHAHLMSISIMPHFFGFFCSIK